jgi:trigger factor
MATVTRENIGLLHDKLSVKLNKEDYYPAFEQTLKKHSKTANIPGFRKGMVPAGMIKKMYGPSLFSEEVLRTIEKELNAYLRNENPNIFAQPLPMASNDTSQLDMSNADDVTFDFEIGLKPTFEIANLASAPVTFFKVQVTDEMVQEEVARMQMKGGKMTEPETIDNLENVLNVLFSESDANGNVVEGGIQKENSLLLKYFSPALQQQLMGKQKGDSIVFQLAGSFEGDMLDTILQDLGFEKGDTEAAQKYFVLEIVKLGLVEKRELNEEFFGEVYPGKAIATEAEFRAQLAEEIQQYWNSQSRNQLHDQLYHYLLDETQIDLPTEFLKRLLQNGGEKPKTAEEAEAELPGFINSLKWELISGNLIQTTGLEVSQEELKAYMRNEIMRYFGQMQLGGDTSWLDSYVDRMLKDEKQVDSSYRRLITEKLFAWAEGQTTPQEKVVTAEELTKMQHNHSH